jgi:hypothetical protein
MIRLKLNLRKLTDFRTFTGKGGIEYAAFPIKANAIFISEKSAIMDVTLLDNRDQEGNAEPDKYGNDGFSTLDIGKERREAGERGPIIGNWKHADTQRQGRDVPASEAMKKRDNQASEPDDCDEIPFSPRHAGLPV